MDWRTTTAVLCLYGAVKEFRPATPFLTPFLASPEKNLTLDELYSQVYPYWTYSYMMALIPMFVLTDILRYKPIVMIEAIGLVATWGLLVFGKGVTQMQIMQVSFGVASAAEIAYYSYIYSIVDRKHYKRATSYIRSAALFGKLVAFGLGQTLISTHASNYLVLNQISLGAVCLVTIIAVFLPRVKSEKAKVSMRALSIEEQQNLELVTSSPKEKKLSYTQEYLKRSLEELKTCSKNHELLKWSLWWALASCGVYQVQNYTQSLWKEMQTDPDDVANGVVEFVNTALGAFLSLFIHHLSINWARHGQMILFVTSAIVAGLLYVCSQTQTVMVAYVAYVVIASIYHMLITAASANVAKELSSNNHGLIFGCNTFLAVCLQSILTLVVVDSRFLHLGIRTQFVIYSGYFAIVALIFAVFFVISLFSKKTENETG
ncbi:CRE-FOLT-1 protein [Caenorhabditis remanei]|uniref:CRE-FOLT-1 protein n=1 Tax=Caenorhabditis remanei TaxID=31234 RepID=E3NGS2_CAERE|nr:CRE-FOLT-1 protein [Caenorhabditis remanei]